jgi:hypothetical protein
MAKNPNPSKSKAEPRGVSVKDAMNAPVVYFEGAANFGCNNGIANVTLAAARYLATDEGGVAMDVIAVAHLRCSISAAADLRNALDSAILLGSPAGDGGKTN